MLSHWIFVCCLLSLSGCRLGEQLSTLGEPPNLTHIQDPTRNPGFVPVTMPTPPMQTSARASNSLWETGSRAFFKDQRANRVGDIVTAVVEVTQTESMAMTPNISRESKGSLTISGLMGAEKMTNQWFHNSTGKNTAGNTNDNSPLNPTWMDFDSKPELKGKAQYNVNDSIQFKIACYVVQMLPNGNMVIQGRQEIRLVNELREITIMGIVRREDITSSNTIHSNKIAEMRISYGGRGELSDMQSFPVGQQLLNKVMPF